MVTAIVLLKVARKEINVVAEKLADLDGVREVYSVGGQHDLVAILGARDNEHLADVVTNHMLLVDGIIDSETLIAFRVFSQHDLESMFSIGLE